MASGRHAAGRSARAAHDGLPVPNFDRLIQRLRTVLQDALKKRVLQPVRTERGLRETCYFCEPVKALVGTGEKSLPAINIHEGATSIWVVVELVTERDQRAYSIHHVSIKVLEGITQDSPTMCFRAEWDFRDSPAAHAQPHWNVHGTRALEQPSGVEQENFEAFARDREPEETGFESFAEAAEQEASAAAGAGRPDGEAGDTLVPAAKACFSPDHLEHFHFAMAVDWHGTTRLHSPVITEVEQLVQWISECSKYVGEQVNFMLTRS